MGRIMDAKHYDKIADYLLQFRGKIPNVQDLGNKYAISEQSKLIIQIDNCLKAIDRYAMLDDKGWIK